MPRTVVPPVVVRGERVSGTGDGLPERLVKYVPAETLAFFVPISASLDGERTRLLVLVLVAGVLGTVGYLWLGARRLKPEKRPLVAFYPLAALAFLTWALGTSPAVAEMVRVDHTTAAVVFGIAVLLIPLADEVLTRLVRG